MSDERTPHRQIAHMTNSEIPSSVYRYRTTAEHELTAIRESYIWFSSPLEFNDPYDRRIDATIQERDPFRRVRQVHYSECLPLVDPLTAMKPGQRVDDIMASLATKHKAWEYEEEWRLFDVEKSKRFFYPVSLLKSITLGSECSAKDLDRVAQVAKTVNVPLFKMKRSTVDYSMTPEPVL